MKQNNILRNSNSYSKLFVVSFVVALLLPSAIPTVTENFTWIFVVVVTLFAWLMIKWDSVASLKNRSSITEMSLGASIIIAIYAYNFALHKEVGLLDMSLIVAAVALSFYGFRSFRLFIVPAAYLVILIAGYWVEFNIPQVVGLQYWEANLMASFMRMLSVSSAVTGNVVTLGSGSATIALEVAQACTGIKGILAFGTLSSMAVLDIKVSKRRLALILAIGFLGTFLIDLARLAVIFLTFFYAGVDAGQAMHAYLGYSLFIAWVIVYWYFSFKYLLPRAPSASLESRTTATGPFQGGTPALHERRMNGDGAHESQIHLA